MLEETVISKINLLKREVNEHDETIKELITNNEEKIKELETNLSRQVHYLSPEPDTPLLLYRMKPTHIWCTLSIVSIDECDDVNEYEMNSLDDIDIQIIVGSAIMWIVECPTE